MKNYRVIWCHPSRPDVSWVSVVAYDLKSAEGRRDLLISQHMLDVEIINTKPGSYKAL